MPDTARLPPELSALPDAALLLDRDGSIIGLNVLAREMFRIEPDAPPRHLTEIVNDPEPVVEWLADPGGCELLRVRVEAERSNRTPFSVELAARRTGGGGAVCVARELLQDRQGGEAQRYFDIAFETSPVGMALFNTDGEYTRVNATLCRILGRAPDELLGRRDQELTHPDDRERDVDEAWRVLRGEISTSQREKRFVRPDGSIVWTIANLTFLRDDDGHPLSWVGQYQDITAGKRREDELTRLADLDPLTGLLNRRSFERCFEEVSAGGRGAALLVIDLDGFKHVNDAHGHSTGDLVLTAVADGLSRGVRRTDYVARLGGDEFAVLLPGAGRDVGETVRDSLTATLAELTVEATSVSASIGVAATEPGSPASLTELLSAADREMYVAKGRLPVR